MRWLHLKTCKERKINIEFVKFTDTEASSPKHEAIVGKKNKHTHDITTDSRKMWSPHKEKPYVYCVINQKTQKGFDCVFALNELCNQIWCFWTKWSSSQGNSDDMSMEVMSKHSDKG